MSHHESEIALLKQQLEALAAENASHLITAKAQQGIINDLGQRAIHWKTKYHEAQNACITASAQLDEANKIESTKSAALELAEKKLEDLKAENARLTASAQLDEDNKLKTPDNRRMASANTPEAIEPAPESSDSDEQYLIALDDIDTLTRLTATYESYTASLVTEADTLKSHTASLSRALEAECCADAHDIEHLLYENAGLSEAVRECHEKEGRIAVEYARVLGELEELKGGKGGKGYVGVGMYSPPDSGEDEDEFGFM